MINVSKLIQDLLADQADLEAMRKAELWERDAALEGLEDWEDDWDDSKVPRKLATPHPQP